jgi:tetratricopeptide (TPR) repeat protein
MTQTDPARQQYQLGYQFLIEQDWPRALKHFRKAVALSPDTGSYHWGLGSAYFHQAKPDLPAAILEFEIVTKLKPDWSEGYYCLALAREASGALKEAVPVFERAIQLAPEDSRIPTALGVCLTKLKDYKRAIQQLRRGIQLKPHYGEASAHLFLADALLLSGQSTEARKEWKFVLTLPEMYPEHGEAAKEARRKLEELSISNGRRVRT